MKTTTPETNTPEAQAIRQAIRAGYTIVRTPELPHDGARFPDIEERGPRSERDPEESDEAARERWQHRIAAREHERRGEFLWGFARAAGIDIAEASDRWNEYAADLTRTQRNSAEQAGQDAGWEMGDKWRKNVKHQKS